MLRTTAAAILFCAPLALLAIPGDIVLPIAPVITEPEPTPSPRPAIQPIDKLAVGQWYVIESKLELITLQSPEGVVDIDQMAGPIIARGMFVDGIPGKVETRTLSSPFVYFVAAKLPGKVELILIPVGVSEVSEIVRQVLTVSGVGPQPPPDPDPIPDPEPNPTPKVKNVSLAIVEDVMNRSPETAILMNAVVNWSEFIDSGNDWRAYDLTTGEAKGIKAIDDLNGPSPGLVIYDKATGTMIHRGNLPTTVYEFKTLIGGLTNGG